MKPKITRIAIERNFSLNTSAETKFEIANANAASWTIFVNKLHTIAHVVPKGGDMWVRIKLRPGIKKESDTYVELYLHARLIPYLQNI